MTASFEINKRLGRACAACSLGAGALGLTGLVSWWMTTGDPTAFSGEYVPMAPSTAYLVLLLSVAAFLRSKASPTRPVARKIELALSLLVLGFAVIFALQHVLGFGFPVEDWLSPSPGTVRGIPVGRISPLTAVCFVGVAAALLCGRLRSLRWLAGWLAVSVLAASLLFLAGYLAGKPFLYGGSMIPMALLTSAAFVLLSASTVLAAGVESWPLRIFLSENSREDGRGMHRVEWPLLLLFLTLTSGIGVVGMRYLNRETEDARAVAHGQLEVMANQSARQIANWRTERLGQAELISAVPYSAQRPMNMQSQPQVEGRQRASAWLQRLRAGGAYERVLLLDDELTVRWAVPKTASLVIADVTRNAAMQALTNRQAVLTDLYRTPESGGIFLDMLVPITLRTRNAGDTMDESTEAAPRMERLDGVLALQVDAKKSLFSMILNRATTSPSAEVLLVRPEGQDVLFLNELRHIKGTAMTMRRPLSDPRLPAAAGLRGQYRFFEGVDYRGVAVEAVTRRVPGTEWLVVAKIDQDELYAPLRQETVRVVVLSLVLLMALTLGVTVIWRQRNEHFLRAQLALERERRALAERSELLMKHAADAILLADEQDRILEANDRALALYGYSLAELQAMRLLEIRPPEAREHSPQAPELATQGRVAFETLHQRKDGTVFPVDISSGLVEIGGVRYKLNIVRDITQRKAHEAEIERLDRLYATLSQVNQTIVRCQSREELFQDICRAAVDFGRFKAAWIGWKIDGSDETTTIAHHASDATPMMPGWTETCGVLTEALRTGQPSLCKRSPGDSLAGCCRQVLAPMGVQACAAFPLRLRGAICGGFNVCSIDPGFFNADEIRMLEEVAADVSFALDKLDKEEERKRTEAALQESELSYRTLADTGQALVWTSGLNKESEYFNRPWLTFRGRTLDQELGNGWTEGVHPDDLDRCVGTYMRAFDGQEPFVIDYRLRNHAGEFRWVQNNASPRYDRQGNFLGYIGHCLDITERKRAEQERTAMETQLRQQQKLESIGTLAGGVAHEINNPVNGIMNYAQLIHDRLPAGSALVEFTSEILHETQRVSGIVRDLLLFARNEKQSHSPARVVDIVNGTLSLIRTIIRQDQITLTVDMAADLPELKCRSQQIQQVLMNLMTNARDALNERYPGFDPDKKLAVSTRLIDKDGSQWIRMTVEDHGTGIAPEIMERMFDPFYTTKPRSRGTGLGLAISHGIVKEHQGELTVESELGRFTRMHLDLPLDNGWMV